MGEPVVGVDMLLLRERRKEVESALVIVQGMAKQGFGLDFCHRETLIWSWSYFEMGAIEEGIQVLSSLTPRYIHDVLPGQMACDPNLREVAAKIADRLVEAGKVSPSVYLPLSPFGQPTTLLMG